MRRGSASIAANPVLIGAATTLVVLVAVFLSYNANSGLPFVPTYELRAQLPNAANLVVGNEVRIGGARGGAITAIKAVPNRTGPPTARVEMQLDKNLQPLPADSSLIVRSRSALGLKYIQLTPGSSRQGFKAGATVPLAQARPRPVEIDEVLNTFDARTRQ